MFCSSLVLLLSSLIVYLWADSAPENGTLVVTLWTDSAPE